MAKRHVSYTFPDMVSFVDQYQTTLQHGSLFLPPEVVGSDDLANELKLDLVLPSVGRVGPIKAQVIHRDPSGGVALRLPNLQDEAGTQIQQAMDSLDKLIPVLASMNKIVSKEQFDALQSRVEELETQLQEAEADRDRLEAQVQAGVPMATSSGVAPAANQTRSGRGFAVPDVRDLEPAIEGVLGDRTFRDAIIQLSIARLTGLMTVQYPDGKIRYGFWFQGGPVGWRTDPIQESEVL